jgi:hypothetical protein
MKKYFIALTFSMVSTVVAADSEIASMLYDYEKNQARFFSLHKNKSIQKIGVVQSILAESTIERAISEASKVPPIFLISINVSGSKVSCFINDEKVAVKLNQKDSVKFEGTISGITMNGDGLMVSNCKIFRK